MHEGVHVHALNLIYPWLVCFGLLQIISSARLGSRRNTFSALPTICWQVDPPGKRADTRRHHVDTSVNAHVDVSKQTNVCIQCRSALLSKQHSVHATAMQCAIATCISAVQTSSQSHQPYTEKIRFQHEAGSPPNERFAIRC